jgi:phosphopantothenoylcysteine decarboxylase/phosphopantothenate--cysteine ligase
MAEVLLGVTGGAAAFKACALASLFRKAGHKVTGVLTPAATRFIGPVQLACVAGQPVYTSLFPEQPAEPAPHIALTDNLDLMVVAPATADFLARAARGFAGDLLSAAFLACDAPVVMAPTMNTRMWNHPAVRENVRILQDMGVVMAGPVEGSLACGTSGSGRMMEPEDIFEVCFRLLGRAAV